MPYVINCDDNETDFKEPLSPTPTAANPPSRLGSAHSLATARSDVSRALNPSPYLTTHFGLMGAVGVAVSALIFVLDLASDALLAYALWNQAQRRLAGDGTHPSLLPEYRSHIPTELQQEVTAVVPNDVEDDVIVAEVPQVFTQAKKGLKRKSASTSPSPVADTKMEEADSERNYHRAKEERLWFAITLVIIVVPLIVINIFSLIWYTQNKDVVGDYSAFYRKNMAEKVICVLLHVLLMGPLIRYVDLIKYRRRIRTCKVRIEMGSKGSVQRLTPKGEVSAILLLQVISLDTAMLDMLHGILQDAPQLVFQIFLLYRSPSLVTGEVTHLHLTVGTQILKIAVGLAAISWSLVSYQDEVRRSVPGWRKLPCGATIVCLAWRACMVGARVLAIGSFAALQVNGEGGLVKVYSDNAPSGTVLSFPTIATLVLTGHWFLMVIWIHSQKTTFCNTEQGGARPLLEFLYNCVMAWVHVFCYVNMKDTPSRGRLTFYYLLVFFENTSFMVVWYMQLITKDMWLRVTVVFSEEALFVIGLACAIGYYSFLHPSRDKRPLDTPWQD